MPWEVQLLRVAAGCIAFFVCAPRVFAAAPVTTTTLAITSKGSAVSSVIQGDLVTFTASVSSSSGPITVGQVEFCDASWPYCTDIHQVGLAQLTSAGTATLRFVPPVGNRTYKAVFLGTNSYAASASSVQNLTVTASGFKYASTTTLVPSGLPGNYALNATVTGDVPPSGTISFLDTDNSNYVLATATLTTSQLTFLNSDNPAITTNVGAMATADFNADGISDLVVSAFPTGTSGMVTILLGKGDGTFLLRQPFQTPYPVQAVKVADFNGDGVADVMMLEVLRVGSTANVWTQIAFGNGDGSFTLGSPLMMTTSNAGPEIGTFTVGDFNGDGKIDLVLEYAPIASTPVTYPLSLWFYPGNGDGTFGQPTVTNQGPNLNFGVCASSMAAADFNGDGKLDLACPTSANVAFTGTLNPPPGSVSVLLGDGHGSFSFGSSAAVGFNPMYVAVADFNGDGKPDLATASWFAPIPGSLVTLLTASMGSGDGTFSAPTFLPASMNAQTSVLTGDFNGDGLQDIVAAYAAGSAPAKLFSVYLSNGDGTFSANDAPVPHAILGSLTNAASDFNLDGRWDMALQGGGGGPLGIFLSQPIATASVTVIGISPVGSGIHQIVASYPGLGNVLGPSISNTVGLQAEQVPTTLTLLAVPGNGLGQQAFTLTAALDPTSAQNHSIGGTVTFYNGAASLGTNAVMNGTATLNVAAGLPVGTYKLTATYSGDTNFMASTGTMQYTVLAPPPPITFTVPNHTFGDPPFTVSATSPSTGAFTYTIVSGPATISGTTVTLTGAGTVSLQASQAASTSYSNGTQTASFTVVMETQTISFPAPASPVNLSVGTVALSATASSGLPVTFSVVSGPGTISGSTVSITGVGTVVVAANQAGNGNYLAAGQVTRTIVVNKGLPVVVIAASQNPIFLQNQVTLTATVSSSATTPTGSVTFFEGSTVLGTATLSSGTGSITVAALPIGSNPITAIYSGDGSYNGATSPSVNEVVQDFTITITGNPAETIQYGGTATFTFAVAPVGGSSMPAAIGFSVNGLPQGSTISFSPATLPSGSGASNVSVTVQVPKIIAATKAPLRGSRALVALALCFLMLPFRRRLRLRRLVSCILLVVAAVCASAALTGCGADIIVPRVLNYTVTVTASSGALSHSANAGLIVQ